MSAYRPYPKYKPSGVEWLGDVPEEWEIGALKHLVAVPITDGPHETPQFLDEGIPFVSAEAVSSGRIDFSKVRACISPEDNVRYSQKYSPKLHDIYMVKSGATTGITAIVEDRTDFNIWSPLAAIRCGKKADPHFVLNFMRSRNFLDAITLNWSFGTQQNIGMGVIENLHCTLPPLPEQQQIAAFLDRECGKLDALQAKQERLIELLKEKRQALISHAVTRGLAPTAKLKPSGIEWLGDVPEHWVVCRLKHISPQITVGIVVEPSKYYAETGVPALRSLNIRPRTIVEENFVFISEKSNAILSKSKLSAGDLVTVRTGQPGTTAVVPEHLHGCNCIDLIVIRKPKADCEQFLAWWFSSDSAVQQFSEGSGGAIQQHFNVAMAVNLIIPLPPLAEQRAIVAHLDEKCGKIDELKSKAERGIELLKERRSALISAAVTGKIDVREN
jgi:type I restriction enzyme S subunit